MNRLGNFCDDCAFGCAWICERMVEAFFGGPDPLPEHVAALVLDHAPIPSDSDCEAA